MFPGVLIAPEMVEDNEIDASKMKPFDRVSFKNIFSATTNSGSASS